MTDNQALAIIVVTYNRADSLKRLLGSIAMSSYGAVFPDLLISIDYSEDFQSEMEAIAEEFEWQGKKNIICYSKNLGLKAHIFNCADLTRVYDAVIILEDDLVVSKGFFGYAQKALEACGKQSNIAGISLYNNTFNETAALPFEAIKTSGDFYLMQVPCSWGQIWTKTQWENFKNWYTNVFKTGDLLVLPEGIRDWSDHSWKKPYILYLIQTNQYFAYPYVSYSMNLNELGTHIKIKDYKFLNSLMLSADDRVLILDKNALRYDAAYMLNPKIINAYSDVLKKYDYQIDLFGSKLDNLADDYWILTTLEADTYEKSFGLELKPIELNIIYGIEGKEIFLTKKKYLKSTKKRRKIINYYYPIPHWYNDYFQQPILRRIKDSFLHKIKSVLKN
jgi:hypothetical protein